MESNKIGFISGVFDLVHEGHIYILKEAKKYCDHLYVSINCDDYIRRNKGREPCMSAEKRAESILNLEDENGNHIVDLVEIREEDSPINTILKIKPAYLFVGNDYSIDKVVGYPECEQWGGRVIIIDRIKGVSTTEILHKQIK